MHPNYCLPFLQGGRLVKVKGRNFDFGWGVVVSVNPRKPGKGQKPSDIPPQESYIVDVLLHVASDVTFAPQAVQDLPTGVYPPAPNDKGKLEVVPVMLSCLDSIGHVRIFLPKDLKTAEQKNGVRKALDEVKKRFPDGIAVLDPIENMGINDDSFKKLLRVSAHSVLLVRPLTLSRKSRSSSPACCPTRYTTHPGWSSCTISTQPRWKSPTRSRRPESRSRMLSQSCSWTS